MTSRNRDSKDTPTRSPRPRAVQKRKDQQSSDSAVSAVEQAFPTEATDNRPPNIRGETRLRVEAANFATRGTATGATQASDAVIDDIRQQLADHLGALRFVNGALIVCVQALQQQDADNDAEIALVLQRTIGDKLDATIDRIEALALGIDLEELGEVPI